MENLTFAELYGENSSSAAGCLL